MLPKVSFITPSFNQGRFIKRTIESILSQDISDFEYVVMDGGSTDETVEILKQYEGRLRWVSEKDNGQTHAINKGLQDTSGEIIGWLNSDDVYYPGAVWAAYEFLQANEQVDLVYGDANYIDEEDGITDLYPTEPWNFRRFKDSCFICQPATFFRRRVVERFGLLDERIQFCMDYEYWLRLASGGAKFAYLPRVLAGSRMYPTNKTLGHTEKFHVEILDTMRRLFGQVPDQWILNYAHMVRGKRGMEEMNPFSSALGVARVAYDAALRWNGQVPPSIQMHLKEAEAGLDAALRRPNITHKGERMCTALRVVPNAVCKVNMATPDQDLLSEIQRYKWYHRIDLGNGIVTPGRDYEIMWNPTLAFMKTVEFQGKRVLDIGCQDGLFSFFAERAGAAEVIAIDIESRPTLNLAASVLGSRVQFRQCSVYHLRSEFAENSFDIVIFNGVLYHLMAPLLALMSINAVLKPNGTMLMESAFYNAEHEKPFIFVAHGPDEIYKDGPSCTFPTIQAYRHMLDMTLFSVKRQDCYAIPVPAGRILIEAQKQERTKGEHPPRLHEYRDGVL
jgi:glycosyltransferase involved in cell wall biosynthesis/2-polyprenyl-3-methyl-5-hydroxy-6-metoxy-1,4-benzoquinol methylase